MTPAELEEFLDSLEGDDAEAQDMAVEMARMDRTRPRWRGIFSLVGGWRYRRCMTARHSVTLAAVLLLAGCGTASAGAVVPGGRVAASPAPTVTVPPIPPVPKPCTPRGALPDPSCTPGVVLASVTQATIRTTVCAAGWARTQRPNRVWTERLKQRMVRAYYPKGTSLTLFRLDALVPIEIGGDHYAVGNQWLEPTAESLVKDRVERAAKSAVCRKNNPLPLATAQQGIAKDWQAFGRSLGVKIP